MLKNYAGHKVLKMNLYSHFFIDSIKIMSNFTSIDNLNCDCLKTTIYARLHFTKKITQQKCWVI